MSESTNTETSFAELFSQGPKAAKEGEVARGTILSIDDEFVQVDIGFKSEGLVAAWEFMQDDGTMTVKVGDKSVDLIEVGPAHTKGDVLVHVPEDGVVFTGDILFIEGTPIMWEGPVGNWIRACERIEELGAAVVVPGHGPITDRSGARAVRDYLVYVRDEARTRFDAGLSANEAVKDISLGRYASWGDAERIAVNVHTLYREFSGSDERASPVELFELMAALVRS